MMEWSAHQFNQHSDFTMSSCLMKWENELSVGGQPTTLNRFFSTEFATQPSDKRWKYVTAKPTISSRLNTISRSHLCDFFNKFTREVHRREVHSRISLINQHINNIRWKVSDPEILTRPAQWSPSNGTIIKWQHVQCCSILLDDSSFERGDRSRSLANRSTKAKIEPFIVQPTAAFTDFAHPQAAQRRSVRPVYSRQGSALCLAGAVIVGNQAEEFYCDCRITAAVFTDEDNWDRDREREREVNFNGGGVRFVTENMNNSLIITFILVICFSLQNYHFVT